MTKNTNCPHFRFPNFPSFLPYSSGAQLRPKPMPTTPFNSTPPRRRRRDADDDDDEAETLLRTPNAQYTLDAAGDVQEQPLLAALPEDAEVGAVMERVKTIFQGKEHLLPEDVKCFMHETVRTFLKEHLRTSGLSKERDYSAGGSLQPLFIQRPAFSDTYFLAEWPAPEADPNETSWPIKIFSVPNKALASVMVRRGYKLIGVVHLPADESRLPPSIAEITRERAEAAAAGVEPNAAPLQLKLPTRAMTIARGGDAPTVAAQIVEAFELKLVWLQKNGSTIVYSPMRLWTKKARKDFGFEPNQRQPFTVRCMIYYYIRAILGQEPATVALSFDQLRDACKHIKAAKEAAKKRGKRKRGDEESSASEDDGDGPLSGDWFTIALRESKKYVVDPV